MSINELQLKLKQFAQVRDWEQFHTVRNLILALVGEVGELAETVQWLGDIDESYFENNPEKLHAISEEIADIFIYLLRIADVIGIDIEKVANEKIASNEVRYSLEKSKGNANKQK